MRYDRQELCRPTSSSTANAEQLKRQHFGLAPGIRSLEENRLLPLASKSRLSCKENTYDHDSSGIVMNHCKLPLQHFDMILYKHTYTNIASLSNRMRELQIDLAVANKNSQVKRGFQQRLLGPLLSCEGRPVTECTGIGTSTPTSRSFPPGPRHLASDQSCPGFWRVHSATPQTPECRRG